MTPLHNENSFFLVGEGENLMLKGCIKEDGTRKVVKINDILKNDKYILFLKENLTIPDLNEGKIFNIMEFHIIDCIQINRN